MGHTKQLPKHNKGVKTVFQLVELEDMLGYHPHNIAEAGI